MGRKAKSRLKEEVFFDLLPRAFTRSQRTYACIDPKNNWVVVGSASASKAEEILTLRRDPTRAQCAKTVIFCLSSLNF